MLTLARLAIRCSALLVTRHDRARWREEWLAELDAIASQRRMDAWRFALGAPLDAISTRTPMSPLSAFGGDAKYAVRQLARRPGHTAAVVACLVVGLVASVATFSVISSLFYGDMAGISGRRDLSEVQLAYDTAGAAEGAPSRTLELMSVRDFDVFRAVATGSAVSAMAAEGRSRFTTSGQHGPVSVKGAFASSGFFVVLRTPVVKGRFFVESDDRAGAPPVAVVSDYFWRTQLDGRDDAVGRTVGVGGVAHTVIGIAPPRFHGLQFEVGEPESEGVQLWMPLAEISTLHARADLDTRFLGVVVRRNSAATLDDVRRELSIAAARIAASNPVQRARATARVKPMGFGPDNAPLEVVAVLGAIFVLPLIVLAIGCANVANLQLACVAEQSRELAIRLSLGATRTQLLRLLTVETLARVLVAVAISLGLISLVLRWVQPLVPIIISLDWRVLTFAVALAVAVAVGTGLAPAWLVLRRGGATELKQTAQSGGLRHSRVRGALIVTQVALSLGLLVMTGLLAKTVEAVAGSAPPALRQQLIADFDPADLDFSPSEGSRFAQTVAARVAADARVQRVSISTSKTVHAGLPAQPRESDLLIVLVATTAARIEVMDLKVLMGRRLTDSDDPSTAVLSQHAADEFAPNASPLGLLLRITDGAAERQVRVVGVVADQHTGPSSSRPNAVVYVPFLRELTTPFELRVRATDRDALTGDLMSLISQIDPRLTWTSLRRGDGAFQQDSREMGYLASGVGAGGLVALLLSATGLYAVMSYVVALRRREIGVRLALGAPPARILSLMLNQSMRLVLAGVGCGLVLAVPLAFWLRAMVVIETKPLDAVVFLPTVALLIAVGTIAAVVPALRASRVDPISTLRDD